MSVYKGRVWWNSVMPVCIYQAILSSCLQVCSLAWVDQLFTPVFIVLYNREYFQL